MFNHLHRTHQIKLTAEIGDIALNIVERHALPGGMLRVGPRSSGADPGPACYGRGGDKPTVVFCTTENSIDHIRAAIEAGADEYVMKPFDRETLEGKMQLVGVA